MCHFFKIFHCLPVKTWYLNKGYHAMPTAMNAMNNLQLKNAGSKHHITVAAQVSASELQVKVVVLYYCLYCYRW